MKRETIRSLAALIYPVRCPICGDVIGANDCFCPKCSEILVKFSGSYSVKGCAAATAAYEYHDNMSEAVMIMKRGIGGNAPFAFGAELAECIRRSGMTDAHMLVPVPMYQPELRKRGFNQSKLIADELSKRLSIPVCSDAVAKSYETLPQKTLGSSERKVNMHGAFSVTKPAAVAGKTIILVDDVCTTGSTLAEAAAVLLESGAARIYCACCCKVV